MNFYQRMEILPLKKRVNCDKCSFTTKQRMFGVFAIDEILRYRWTRFAGLRTLCHPAVYVWVPHLGRLLVWNRLFKVIVHWSDHVSVSACAIWAPEGDLHSLSLWCAGQWPDQQHTYNQTINTTWPSTPTQPDHQHKHKYNQTINSSVHKHTINTTSTTISNQQHWILRTFLRPPGSSNWKLESYGDFQIDLLNQYLLEKKPNIQG